MHDDWFGHRDPFTGRKVGDKDEWLEWDHLLADAFQLIDDYTDEYGLLVWERDDEAAIVDAVRKIHPFKQAIDQRTAGSPNKPYKALPGEYFVPRMTSRRSDDSFQTFRDWVSTQVVREPEESSEDSDW